MQRRFEAVFSSMKSSWAVKACLTTEFTDCDGNSIRKLPRRHSHAQKAGRTRRLLVFGEPLDGSRGLPSVSSQEKKTAITRMCRSRIRRTEVVSVLFQSQSVNSVVRQTWNPKRLPRHSIRYRPTGITFPGIPGRTLLCHGIHGAHGSTRTHQEICLPGEALVAQGFFGCFPVIPWLP